MSCLEPELSIINVMVLYTVQSSLFFSKIIENIMIVTNNMLTRGSGNKTVTSLGSAGSIVRSLQFPD